MKTDFINEIPFPACVVGTDGSVTRANPLMKDVIVFEDIIGANFFTLTGIKRSALLKANEERIILERNDKVFRVFVNTDVSDDDEIVVLFDNRTVREGYRAQLKNERATMIFVNIDNYDELLASVPEQYKRVIPSQIDSIVRRWGNGYESPVMSTDDDRYVIVSTFEQTQQMIKDNFGILDEVRNIDADVDFPVSVSIGVGMSEVSLNEATDLAQAALELALGRGGDQAVVKSDDQTHYYGGSTQTVEKSNRGKARVIAHAIKRLISSADKVFIMGHRWPDMDSFGAAIGAYSICRYFDKDAYIVIEEHNDALEAIFSHAYDTDDYNIIKHEKAIQLAKDATSPLLIVVDTNRPILVECPELLDIIDIKAVIDHHRRTEDSFQNTTVSYNESYASSASELVSEIIQHIAQKRIINKFEGEAMLAGIMVDTNNFSGRAGVRTFEAAAWLKRTGADTTEVKRFFQTEKSDLQAKAAAIADAEFCSNGVVYACAESGTMNATIINAQVADELLMVKGVKASFVLGTNEKKQTIISARSLGNINVQFLMEKFGGGGHFTSAAAQIDAPRDEVSKQLKKMVDDYLNGTEEEK